eukprot:jgi/Psemu1/51962/gm1.51962_g
MAASIENRRDRLYNELEELSNQLEAKHIRDGVHPGDHPPSPIFPEDIRDDELAAALLAFKSANSNSTKPTRASRGSITPLVAKRESISRTPRVRTRKSSGSGKSEANNGGLTPPRRHRSSSRTQRKPLSGSNLASLEDTASESTNRSKPSGARSGTGANSRRRQSITDGVSVTGRSRRRRGEETATATATTSLDDAPADATTIPPPPPNSTPSSSRSPKARRSGSRRRRRPSLLISTTEYIQWQRKNKPNDASNGNKNKTHSPIPTRRPRSSLRNSGGAAEIAGGIRLQSELALAENPAAAMIPQHSGSSAGSNTHARDASQKSAASSSGARSRSQSLAPYAMLVLPHRSTSLPDGTVAADATLESPKRSTSLPDGIGAADAMLALPRRSCSIQDETGRNESSFAQASGIHPGSRSSFNRPRSSLRSSTSSDAMLALNESSFAQASGIHPGSRSSFNRPRSSLRSSTSSESWASDAVLALNESSFAQASGIHPGSRSSFNRPRSSLRSSTSSESCPPDAVLALPKRSSSFQEERGRNESFSVPPRSGESLRGPPSRRHSHSHGNNHGPLGLGRNRHREIGASDDRLSVTGPSPEESSDEEHGGAVARRDSVQQITRLLAAASAVVASTRAANLRQPDPVDAAEPRSSSEEEPPSSSRDSDATPTTTKKILNKVSIKGLIRKSKKILNNTKIGKDGTESACSCSDEFKSEGLSLNNEPKDDAEHEHEHEHELQGDASAGSTIVDSSKSDVRRDGIGGVNPSSSSSSSSSNEDHRGSLLSTKKKPRPWDLAAKFKSMQPADYDRMVSLSSMANSASSGLCDGENATEGATRQDPSFEEPSSQPLPLPLPSDETNLSTTTDNDTEVLDASILRLDECDEMMSMASFSEEDIRDICAASKPSTTAAGTATPVRPPTIPESPPAPVAKTIGAEEALPEQVRATEKSHESLSSSAVFGVEDESDDIEMSDVLFSEDDTEGLKKFCAGGTDPSPATAPATSEPPNTTTITVTTTTREEDAGSAVAVPTDSTIHSQGNESGTIAGGNSEKCLQIDFSKLSSSGSGDVFVQRLSSGSAPAPL